MKRRERAAAFVAGAVVATIAAGSAVVLSVHGAAPVTTVTSDDGRVPADISWFVYFECANNVVFDGPMMSTMDDTGVITFVPAPHADGIEAPDPVALASINACFAQHPVEGFEVWEDIPADRPAARLVLYDQLNRWMRPCFVGNGGEVSFSGLVPAQRPQLALEGYLAEDEAPWLNLYAAAFLGPRGAPSLEEMLAARRACGSPSAPFA